MSATHCLRDGLVEVDVDDPGHGRLSLYLDEDLGHGRRYELCGSAMGRLLVEITTAVIEQRAADLAAAGVYPLRGTLDAQLTRELLPGLQRMVLLAIAGTDRYERVIEPVDTGQLCVNCNEGSPYHQEVTISARCMERGHEPFGARARSWE